MGLFGADFTIIVSRNYGLTPGDEIFNEIVEVSPFKSENTVCFDSGVNGKTFAFEIRCKPDLGPKDTALLEPPFEIDFNYEIEEVEEVPVYQYDIKPPIQAQPPRRKPIPPEEDVEYRFDLPFLRK